MHPPREVTAFEVEVLFQFSAEEVRIIEECRLPELKLGLALQIGFLRMSGRLLDAVRMVPPLLWRRCYAAVVSTQAAYKPILAGQPDGCMRPSGLLSAKASSSTSIRLGGPIPVTRQPPYR
jgi:hypothetical protein